MKTKKLLRRVKDFIRGEDGPTTVEYAVMLMMIALAVISALQILGPAAADNYNSTADSMSEVRDAARN
jgi:Flp pilus assembly pilin Flp